MFIVWNCEEVFWIYCRRIYWTAKWCFLFHGVGDSIFILLKRNSMFTRWEAMICSDGYSSNRAFFYVLCPVRASLILSLDNFLSFVARIKCCLLLFLLNTFLPIIYTRHFMHCFPLSDLLFFLFLSVLEALSEKSISYWIYNTIISIYFEITFFEQSILIKALFQHLSQWCTFTACQHRYVFIDSTSW